MQEKNISSKGDVVYWSDEIYIVTVIDGNKKYITDVYLNNAEKTHETIHVVL